MVWWKCGWCGLLKCVVLVQGGGLLEGRASERGLSCEIMAIWVVLGSGDEMEKRFVDREKRGARRECGEELCVDGVC